MGTFHNRVAAAFLLAVALVAGTTTSHRSAGAIAPGIDDSVKLNQIQTIGTHNSYHLRATQAEYEVRQAVAPEFNVGLDYEHPALGVQFSSQRIRQIELDVAADPAGGRYDNPLIRSYANEGPLSAADKAIMDQPGTKVIHASDVDYRSNCLTLVICLQNVKAWSDANPDHVPIVILLEYKDEPIPVVPSPPAVAPIPWDTTTMPAVDAEIASVFAPSDLVTPDDVKGGYASVNAGALAGNWPTLGASRGKVMFIMDNSGAKRTDYLTLHPGLSGAPVFTNSTPGAPDAAFIEMNDPTGANTAAIQHLVSQGYVVRTRADGDTIEARSNDTGKRDAALASGAQWISTDFPGAGSASYLGSSYSVELPSGTTARCNPVNGPDGCVDAALDTSAVTPLPAGYLGTLWDTSPVTSTTVPTAPADTAPPQSPDAATPAEPVDAQPTFTG